MLLMPRWLPPPVLVRTLGCMAAVVSTLVGAQTSALQMDQVLQAKEARAWLTRIHEAPKQRSFTGTFVFSAGGAMSSARIAHYCEGTNQYERIDALDGPERQVLRHNDVVHTVWPESRSVVVEQRDHRSAFPALLLSPDEQIFANYEVRSKGRERVAGHDANVIHLQPRDGFRYGYRLWSDSESGLLLRADVLDERNEVLESSAFSDVVIGVKARPDMVLDAIKKLDGYKVVKLQLNSTRLDAHGWVMRASVPGFKEISCFTRPLNLPAAKVDLAKPAVQVIYADGLTHVSLFIEPFEGNRHARQVPAVYGATRTFSRRNADWWVTAVGDVPVATLRAFVEGVDRK